MRVSRIFVAELVCILILLVYPTDSISPDQYNVTFPCGRLQDAQECRFPSQYCDVVMGSCSFCNEDTCRELDSNPSCRAFCYDLTHPSPGTTITNVELPTTPPATPINQAETESCPITPTTIGLVIGVCVLGLVVTVGLVGLIVKCRQKKKRERDLEQPIGMNRTDNDNMVSIPSDTGNERPLTSVKILSS